MVDDRRRPGRVADPSEFMDVNYGASVKHWLLDKVTLLHIHRFDPNDVQFADALVSSAVVWFRKESPRARHEVRFTYGGSLEHPTLERSVPAETLRRDPKWTRYPMNKRHEAYEGPVLGDFFEIKRGLATGAIQVFHPVRCRDQEARAADGGVQADIAESALLAGRRGGGRSKRHPCAGEAFVPARLSVDRRRSEGALSDVVGVFSGRQGRWGLPSAISAGTGRRGTRRNTGRRRRSCAPTWVGATRRGAGRSASY